MKTCPRCKLINPPSSMRCDCGYDFASGRLRSSYIDSSDIDEASTAQTMDPASAQQLQSVLDAGIRYVIFQYCISILVMTFRRPSRVYAVGPDVSRFRLGLKYSLVSLLFGWWGIPWGPIWTIGTIATNCGGGKDITHDVVAAVTRRAT